ncbi:MAG: hypothetical protein GW779_04230 [Candidatus Altiarchaeum hamiconexum]|uniref:Uncharacterized protein n=1 Tax=Candidatus Altarchaeum hamiconexum TaxID=1803513 RepID=A0A8J7YV04_9ARCH|nr:hypothetical protein [Candidatus Altarchaeum hamiconexum]NCN69059.1 hypothetical protein [Candidatus Altarchaeum hamiconexum]NCS91604.1 hypothetical protein [Candidatus Altarchaeum hamiconexum]NCT01533.1 hypothetical protein [Candidatus Altarchaeum hamiconexum]
MFNENLRKNFRHRKEAGIFYPGYGIYGGIIGFYDYGTTERKFYYIFNLSIINL